VQVDVAAIAEVAAQLARTGIERNEAGMDGSAEETRLLRPLPHRQPREVTSEYSTLRSIFGSYDHSPSGAGSRA